MESRRAARRSLVTGLVLLAAASAALAKQPLLAGFRRVAAATVPLDGREVTLRIPRGARREDIAVVLEGSFTCSYNGRTYYVRGNSGDPNSGVGYVLWTPPKGFLPIDAGVSSQRVVLGPSFDVASVPETAGAYVNIDQLVRELMITPSEVKQSLSGRARLEVWQTSRPPLLAALLFGGLVLIGVLAVIARLRRSDRASTADAQAILRRIERKYAPAMKAIDDQRWDAHELRSQLTQLRDGAREFVRRIGAFRRAAGSVDRAKLEAEISQAERQLAEAQRDDLRAEVESTLAAKRKLRELLTDTQANEARYLLRLSKIEAAMDTASLWVTGQEAQLADEGVDRKAIDTIHKELESLDRAIEELRVV